MRPVLKVVQAEGNNAEWTCSFVTEAKRLGQRLHYPTQVLLLKSGHSASVRPVFALAPIACALACSHDYLAATLLPRFIRNHDRRSDLVPRFEVQQPDALH